MRILTVWGQRRSFQEESPELMVAWDEYTLDCNWDGFEAECQKERESWGDELVQERQVWIEIADDVLDAAFRPPVIEGVVSE